MPSAICVSYIAVPCGYSCHFHHVLSGKSIGMLMTSLLLCRVPMYYEAKVLFVLYLWHPKTQGAAYLYSSMLQPFLARNEGAIDQCIEELKTAIFDYAASYFQKCAETSLLSYRVYLAVSRGIVHCNAWHDR